MVSSILLLRGVGWPWRRKVDSGWEYYCAYRCLERQWQCMCYYGVVDYNNMKVEAVMILVSFV
jgi:hypothetical protein